MGGRSLKGSLGQNSPLIKIVPRKQDEFRKKLVARIDAFNQGKMGPTRWKALSLEAKNTQGKLVGGLTGFTYLGWLYVDILFVEERYRGQGLGSRLMRTAESWAKKHGYGYVHLSSFSFQAPGFYKKLGYKIHGKLGPFPKGHIRFYFKKKI
jgi:GNAT superfamily N-acetyltransferase